MRHTCPMTNPRVERGSLFAAALCLAGLTLAATVARAEPDPIGQSLSQGMAHFVSGLDADQRDEALYDFDDDERFDLRLAPLWLEGLRIDQMSEAQWTELDALLGEVLSPVGLDKMNTIRSLEREVAELEGGFFGFVMSRMRDARRYFLVVFGEPSVDEPWGMRFDGHHLSLNWTSVPGAPLSATPLFFGAQPRVVPEGLERAGLRVLAGEEELAIAFLNGLSEDERRAAQLPWDEGSSIRRPMSISGDVDLVVPAATGLDRSVLDPASRARLDALVDVHLSNFAPAIAARYRAQLLESPEPLTIVYAAVGDSTTEPLASGRALYYRIQGGGFLIEFDDTAEAADHIHVVLRDPASDFGRDVLVEHLRKQHSR